MIFKPCSIDKINHFSREKLKWNESTSSHDRERNHMTPRETSVIHTTMLSGNTLAIHSHIRRETLPLKRKMFSSKHTTQDTFPALSTMKYQLLCQALGPIYPGYLA